MSNQTVIRQTETEREGGGRVRRVGGMADRGGGREEGNVLVPL